MEILKDLERVLWHEIGHLTVDIMETGSNDDFYIDDFWVSYHVKAVSGQKWGGAVKMLPSIPIEELVKDDEKTSFAMLGLISGCIFQTIFLREFLKEGVDFEQCFCPQNKCAGYGDMRFYLGIASEIRKKYGLNKEFITFSERDIYGLYYETVAANQNFLVSINELIIKLRDMVFEIYQQAENKEEFKFCFKDNGLEALIEDVCKIMKETMFSQTIISIKDEYKKKMIQ